MEIWNLYNQLYNSALKEWRGECGGGGGGGGASTRTKCVIAFEY